MRSTNEFEARCDRCHCWRGTCAAVRRVVENNALTGVVKMADKIETLCVDCRADVGNNRYRLVVRPGKRRV